MWCWPQINLHFTASPDFDRVVRHSLSLQLYFLLLSLWLDSTTAKFQTSFSKCQPKGLVLTRTLILFSQLWGKTGHILGWEASRILICMCPRGGRAHLAASALEWSWCVALSTSGSVKAWEMQAYWQRNGYLRLLQKKWMAGAGIEERVMDLAARTQGSCSAWGSSAREDIRKNVSANHCFQYPPT